MQCMKRESERANKTQMLSTRFVPTHKIQIQIVVSFGCLHFEAAFLYSTVFCSALCIYYIAPIWMLYFLFLLYNERMYLVCYKHI